MWSNVRFVYNGFTIRLMVIIFFFFCSRFLFIYVDLELFFCLSLVFVSNSGFVLRLLLVYSVVLGFVSHFNV